MKPGSIWYGPPSAVMRHTAAMRRPAGEGTQEQRRAPTASLSGRLTRHLPQPREPLRGVARLVVAAVISLVAAAGQFRAKHQLQSQCPQAHAQRPWPALRNRHMHMHWHLRHSKGMPPPMSKGQRRAPNPPAASATRELQRGEQQGGREARRVRCWPLPLAHPVLRQACLAPPAKGCAAPIVLEAAGMQHPPQLRVHRQKRSPEAGNGVLRDAAPHQLTPPLQHFCLYKRPWLARQALVRERVARHLVACLVHFQERLAIWGGAGGGAGRGWRREGTLAAGAGGRQRAYAGARHSRQHRVPKSRRERRSVLFPHQYCGSWQTG